jgi:aminopeptidase
MSFDRNLAKYALTLIKVGLNLQPGQRLIITGANDGAPIELAPLARLIAKAAYQAGARLVDVMWRDEQMLPLRYAHAPRDSFEEYADWRAKALLELAQAGDAILFLSVEDPALLADADPQAIATARRVALQKMKPFYDLRSQHAMTTVIALAPTAGWARAVFPDLSPGAALERAWDTVFDICRVTADDPVRAWQNHIRQLVARCDTLNARQYVALVYSAPGTALTVGLPKGHVWRTARFTTRGGIRFVGNIPTEEVFTLPHKDRVEGTVTATRPLAARGAYVENFSLTFEAGRIVAVTAPRGLAHLEALVDTDAGARSLGEVALVPHSSPVSQSGLLFYNILYDENAACHLALGRAYKFSLDGGETMTPDRFAAAGGNDSILHLDFMIGSDQLDVDGVLPGGGVEPVIRSGEWAFSV